MPGTIKKKQRNFAELMIMHLRNKLPKRCFKSQRGILSMKKLNLIIRKIGRCTEEDLTGQDDKKSGQLLCINNSRT